MNNFPYKFKVGDVVRATERIWRKDHRTLLEPGDVARVRRVSQNDHDAPQIIDLDVKGQLPIGDIVCFANLPLELISH